MTRNLEAPWGGRPDSGKVGLFEIPEDKMQQLVAWKEEHNKTCRIPEWLNMFTPTHKYQFEFRLTGIGDNIILRCDCGEKFYPDAGDDML